MKLSPPPARLGLGCHFSLCFASSRASERSRLFCRYDWPLTVCAELWSGPGLTRPGWKSAASRARTLRLGERTCSESQNWQGSWSVDVRRDANLSPAVCLGRTSRLGFASVPNGVAPQQQMCRQAIAGRQTKDDLGHLGRITILLAPEGLQRPIRAQLQRYCGPVRLRCRLPARL